MLDIKFIRENLKNVENMLSKRRAKIDLTHVIEIDDTRRKLIKEVEELRRERKEASSEKNIAKGREIKEKVAKREAALAAVEGELQDYLEQIPNMLSEKVPPGNNEEENVEIKKWGEPRKLDFEPKDHLALSRELGIIDVEAASKTSGHGFYYLIGDGARLEIALVHWVTDFLSQKGYRALIPPALVRKKFVEGTGYLPRREEPDIYKIEGEDLYLVATAEISIAGYHSDQIFADKELPKKYVGFSPSFRKEAGSYGKYTHGIYRVHQFDKVEIFKFVLPEDSESAFEEIISLEEEIYQALEIPYRIVNICSGEMSSAASLKYDIEYYDPVNKTYRELTSASNTTDYQARRLNIKFRNTKGDLEFIHTLNGTAIALSRTLIALLENHQQKDGSVRLPKVLHEFLGKDTLQR